MVWIVCITWTAARGRSVLPNVDYLYSNMEKRRDFVDSWVVVVNNLVSLGPGPNLSKHFLGRDGVKDTIRR